MSRSWSQNIVIIRKYSARITRVEVTRMTSAITREMVAVILPLTVKVRKMKRSLRTVLGPAMIS